MKVIAERKMIPILVKVETPDGPRWEWRQVEGVEIELPSRELKSGDTLSIDCAIAG